MDDRYWQLKDPTMAYSSAFWKNQRHKPPLNRIYFGDNHADLPNEETSQNISKTQTVSANGKCHFIIYIFRLLEGNSYIGGLGAFFIGKMQSPQKPILYIVIILNQDQEIKHRNQHAEVEVRFVVARRRPKLKHGATTNLSSTVFPPCFKSYSTCERL